MAAHLTEGTGDCKKIIFEFERIIWLSENRFDEEKGLG